jgi:hypothetical protein
LVAGGELTGISEPDVDAALFEYIGHVAIAVAHPNDQLGSKTNAGIRIKITDTGRCWRKSECEPNMPSFEV